MIFVSSPYSHENPYIEDRRFQAVEAFTADLIRAGVLAYSPIAAFHHMSRRYSLPKDAHFWRSHNQMMLSKASEMAVLMLPGWQESVGVGLEIGWADSMNMPVSYHESAWGAEWGEQ